MYRQPCRQPASHNDGLKLLPYLSVRPRCQFELMRQLGWRGRRFADAVDSIRERRIKLVTCDRSTIRLLRAIDADAVALATAPVEARP